MAQTLTTVNVITLYVEDQQRSKEFYERVFEVAPADENEGTVIFKFDNLFLRLLTRGEAEKEWRGVRLADSDAGQPSSWRSSWTTRMPLCRARRTRSPGRLRSDRPSLGRAQRGVP